MCSFYSMYKREPCGRLLVSVCTSVSCLVNGGPELLEHLRRRYAGDPEVTVEEVECLAASDGAPVMQVNYEFHERMTPPEAERIVEAYRSGELTPRGPSGESRTRRPRRRGRDVAATETRIITKRLRDHPEDSWTLARSRETGGYEGLRKALAMDPAAIAEEVKTSGLRGRGGAGFPTATKWSFLPAGVVPRYLVVNCDEAEPSTFKDRMLVERDPHQLIEGIAIASFALGVHQAFVYVRGEFALGADRLRAAVAEARAAGLIGPDVMGSGYDLDIVVHRGAGAYICGEETALLESLEGKHGMPRIRPPFPAIAGLYAKPTVVNNVETLATLPAIITGGGEWYAAMGVDRSRGTRIFSLSGHVNRPGNYEIELRPHLPPAPRRPRRRRGRARPGQVPHPGRSQRPSG